MTGIMKKSLYFLLTGAFLSTPAMAMSLWERIRPPEDISTNGHLIMWLFNYTTFLNLFWFTLVCLGLFGFSYFYSSKRNKKAYYTHGNEKKHLIITALIGLGVFLSVDMVITKVSNNDMRNAFWNFPADDDAEALKVEILAQQWLWNIRYAGKDGVFNTNDDITTNNDLRVPVGKKVSIQLSSKDVIHSFYVPNVRLKTDAIPGRVTRIWFDANKVGEYEIACAEMCGTHHYLMKAKLTVLSQEDYQNWLNERETIAIATNDTANSDLKWGWSWGRN